MVHRIRHGLPHALARDATHRALESYRERFQEFSPEGEWLDADHARVAFHALGRTLEGAVRVDSENIELELDVPFLFRPFQKKAIDVIDGEVRAWIEKAKQSQLA
ncbi:MAG: polyhydroxyalkanoic acid system family protein [Myxococcota bacterium]